MGQLVRPYPIRAVRRFLDSEEMLRAVVEADVAPEGFGGGGCSAVRFAIALTDSRLVTVELSLNGAVDRLDGSIPLDYLDSTRLEQYETAELVVRLRTGATVRFRLRDDQLEAAVQFVVRAQQDEHTVEIAAARREDVSAEFAAVADEAAASVASWDPDPTVPGGEVRDLDDYFVRFVVREHTCPRCGTSAMPKAVFCANCGALV